MPRRPWKCEHESEKLKLDNQESLPVQRSRNINASVNRRTSCDAHHMGKSLKSIKCNSINLRREFWNSEMLVQLSQQLRHWCHSGQMMRTRTPVCRATQRGERQLARDGDVRIWLIICRGIVFLFGHNDQLIVQTRWTRSSEAATKGFSHINRPSQVVYANHFNWMCKKWKFFEYLIGSANTLRNIWIFNYHLAPQRRNYFGPRTAHE